MKRLFCALLVASLAMSAASPTGCGRGRSVPLAEFDAEPLLVRLVGEGDASALLTMTRHSGIAQISDRLRAMPRGPGGMADDRSATIAQHTTGKDEVFLYDLPRLAVDEAGRPQLAFVSMTVLPRKDNLGNPGSWSMDLLYARCRAGGWEAPRIVQRDGLYVNGLQLLIDRRNAVHLLFYGHNNSLEPMLGGLPPKQYGLFHRHRQESGQWSEPENLVAESPSLLHDFDACLDADNRLHLVWAAFKRGHPSETIQYRCLADGSWSQEEVLPALRARNLTHPVIRPFNHGLNVFVSGQTHDYGIIGLFLLAKDGHGWSRPGLLLDNTGFEHPASAAPAHTLLAVLRHAKSRPDTYLLLQPDERQRMRPCAELPLPGGEYTPGYGWSLPCVARDGENRPLTMVSEAGNVYLIRPGSSGEPEAILLRAGASADDAVRGGQLAVSGQTLHAAWAESSTQKHAVRHYRGNIPRDGWRPLSRVFWGSRAGIGLTRMDRMFLARQIRGEAEALEREDLPGAVERYVYVLGNFAEGREVFEIPGRLKEFDQAGVGEVRSQLAKFIGDCPQVLKTDRGPGWKLAELARDLGVVDRRPGN